MFLQESRFHPTVNSLTINDFNSILSFVEKCWVLTEKQKLKFINPGLDKPRKVVLFAAKDINYNTVERYLAEYYHMREEQFKRDNKRIRGENEKLVRKLADEDEELQRVKRELELTREELDLTKRDKWKRLFESVLQRCRKKAPCFSAGRSHEK